MYETLLGYIQPARPLAVPRMVCCLHCTCRAHLGGALGGVALTHLIGPRYVWSYGRTVDKPLIPWFKDFR